MTRTLGIAERSRPGCAIYAPRQGSPTPWSASLHELESGYLGDLQAVEESLGPKGIAKDSALAKYRDPDRLGNAAQELKALTRNAYQKVSGSRRIAPLLDLEGRNRSTSFRVFCEGVRKLSAT